MQCNGENASRNGCGNPFTHSVYARSAMYIWGTFLDCYNQGKLFKRPQCDEQNSSRNRHGNPALIFKSNCLAIFLIMHIIFGCIAMNFWRTFLDYPNQGKLIKKPQCDDWRASRNGCDNPFTHCCLCTLCDVFLKNFPWLLQPR